MRHPVAIVAAATFCAVATAFPMAVRSDSAEAYCVLSKATVKAVPQQGPCRWSQRQGNVNIMFQAREYDFPSDQEGKTYIRLNRGGSEAGPVFTRKGQYTLSVYWRKPLADVPGY